MPDAVLLSCFACDPDAGSEPYVGWKWATEIYAGQRRVILTRRHHAMALAGRDNQSISFRFFDLPFLSALDHRHRLMKLYYVIWQLAVLPYAAWIMLRERLRTVHHITYNAVDFPGVLWAIPFVRFVWGPVGGGQTPPAILKEYYGAAWERQVMRGRMKNALCYNPFVRLALWRASRVLVANHETMQRLRPLARDGVLQSMLETAVDTAAVATQPRQPHTPLRIIWVGRFEARKAPLMLVRIARLLDRDHPGCFDFTMIGDGDMLPGLHEVAADLPNLRLLGPLPFSQMRAAYDEVDVLAFTSLQDTSGNVVLEALSRGLPVVALDHQGSAEILPQGGGVLVPIADSQQVVQGFADALVTLSDPHTYSAASAAALINILDYHTWERRRAQWRRNTATLAQ